MNKTIIININGIVFHIEEDAYEVLKTYMTEVKRHFSYSADSDEIITDIENRLAEMFNERLADQSKQVIITQDVEEVISIMGSVEDFEYTSDESTEARRPLNPEKRFLRDPDNKNIAGVCSGLGYYLDIEAKWIRLIMVALALTTGTTIILYAILWIVVPEARTRQEKMAMRGEPINLHGFKKTFENEEEAFHKMEKSNVNLKTHDTIETVVTSIVNFVGRVASIVIKTLGLFIAICGSMALIGLIAILIFGIGFLKDGGTYQFIINTVNPQYRSEVIFSSFVLLAIPLIALISFAIRVIFNHRIISKTGAFALLILWLTGLGLGIYYGAKIASEFQVGAGIAQEASIATKPVYYLKFNRNKYLSREDSLNLNLNKSFKGQVLSGEEEEFDNLNVDINIENSNVPTLIKQFKARGKNLEDALKNAQGISYFESQQDSILTFDRHIHLGRGTPFRNQTLNLTLKFPIGTRLVIDRDIAYKINNFHGWDCKEDDDWNKRYEVIVAEDGLKCAKDAQEISETSEPGIAR